MSKIFKQCAVFILLLLNLSARSQPQSISSAPGEALHFDGVNDNVRLSHFPRPLYFTIEAWIKSGNSTDPMMIVGWSGTNTAHTAEFYISAGYLTYAEFNGSTFPAVYTAIPMSDTWHHVAVTKSGDGANNCTLYLDGAVLVSATVHHSITTNDLRIGAYNYLNNLGRLFTGAIDEVRIWNRALCLQEIQYNMNCELPAGQNGLLAYHSFNNGIAGGINGDKSPPPTSAEMATTEHFSIFLSRAERRTG
jgi:hypothetical protein